MFCSPTSVLGGFRAQGRTAVKARQVLDDALAVQDAGAFAVVIECVPAPVAKAVTEALEIPTIGIGAGAFTSGQVTCGKAMHTTVVRGGYVVGVVVLPSGFVHGWLDNIFVWMLPQNLHVLKRC